MRTIYRKCPCGETAHDFRSYASDGSDVYACRNCGNKRTSTPPVVEAQPLLDALAAASISVRAMTSEFYRVEGTHPALMTISVRSNGYRVSINLGKRWRTLGTWVKPERVVAEVRSWCSKERQEERVVTGEELAQAFDARRAAALDSIPAVPA